MLKIDVNTKITFFIEGKSKLSILLKLSVLLKVWIFWVGLAI